MKVTLLTIAKTEENYLREGLELYEKRIKHYLPFQLVALPAPKKQGNLSVETQKRQEGKSFLDYFAPPDIVVLLDEKGKEHSSMEFSRYLQGYMNTGIKQLVFVIGGPYGFSEELYKRANATLSLSKLTFSHQMVRLFFVEQLYRAMTILKGEPYHHE